MTDLEMTKLCAEAVGFIPMESHSDYVLTVIEGSREFSYLPLHDDAQAMQLVKRFRLTVEDEGLPGGYSWWVYGLDAVGARSADLNRAIVETIAQMWLERTKSAQSGGQSDDKPLTKVG